MRRIRVSPDRKGTIKFQASIDKNTTVMFYIRDLSVHCVIKKDLIEYDTHIKASETPVSQEFLKTIEPFETVFADIKIIEKELMPLTNAVEENFGMDIPISLDAIRLVIGSNEDDFVTIDETDLLSMDVEPSLQGLLQFINENKDGIIGFADRIFQQDRGNVIFLESKVRNPDQNIRYIQFSILSSLHQRGLFMQQNHQYFGLQLYTVIQCDEINDSLLTFLKSLDIDWEVLFLRRDLAITNWTSVECENNSINLKGYIKSKYDALGFFDINNITRLVVKNKLSFQVADRLAEILNKSRKNHESIFPESKKEPLDKAEIAAAALLACAYLGEQGKNLKFDKDITQEDINKYTEELVRL